MSKIILNYPKYPLGGRPAASKRVFSWDVKSRMQRARPFVNTKVRRSYTCCIKDRQYYFLLYSRNILYIIYIYTERERDSGYVLTWCCYVFWVVLLRSLVSLRKYLFFQICVASELALFSCCNLICLHFLASECRWFLKSILYLALRTWRLGWWNV